MSLFVALVLAAWPVPRDAGADAWAQPENWPNEPGYAAAWPLHSFSDGGVSVDRAWSVTLGSPAVRLGVAASAVDLSDPLIAHAWSLNAGELPTVTDVNGNGRIDVGDLTVADSNANGGVDLADVIAALSDGVDDDGNGKVDDLCGWDFVRNAALTSTDAGTNLWRSLAAPVNDGLPGIGVCPGCTLVPLVVDEASLARAVREATVDALLIPPHTRDVSAALDDALQTTRALVLQASPRDAIVWPLALHPAVFPVARRACQPPNLAAALTWPSVDCDDDSAVLALGAAGLLASVAPDAGPAAWLGLLGNTNVSEAVLAAALGLPAALPPPARLSPVPRSPASPAETCAVDGVDVNCDGGVELHAAHDAALNTDPSTAFVHFTALRAPWRWETWIAAPPLGTTSGQLPAIELGAGSGPPRFVDLDGSGVDVIVASTTHAIRGFLTNITDLAPSPPSGRFAPAIGDLNRDGYLDFIVLGDDGELAGLDVRGRSLPGFPRQLSSAPAGPPVITPTLGGIGLVTVARDGAMTVSVNDAQWTHQLASPQLSSPAAGFIDDDAFADFAIANGATLQVIVSDEFGPSSRSWSKPSAATQALLANLGGNAQLEIIADAVYDAEGAQLVELPGWKPSVIAPALARLGISPLRSLIQIEADGAAFEVTRYDVEEAVRAGDNFTERRVLRRLTHQPAPGGFVVVDMTADTEPDIVVPTVDGLLFIISGTGDMPVESPLPTLGSVLSAPAVGAARDRLELAVRTTRGDVVRWLVTGRVEDLAWESAGHDRSNANNAEVPLPTREVGGLGLTEPPRFPPNTPCSCTSVNGLAAVALLFLLRRASRARR